MHVNLLGSMGTSIFGKHLEKAECLAWKAKIITTAK
jgi:hypothetical protein